MKRDEAAVSNVIGAILVLAGIVVFMSIYNTKWVPTQVANRESDRSDAARAAIIDWADEGEGLIQRTLTDRSFTRSVPLGETARGTNAGSSSGLANLVTTPTMTVYLGTTQLAQATGALTVENKYQRFPPQTLKYAFGGLEVQQGSNAWVDSRSVVQAQRQAGGTLSLTVQVVTITGGPQSAGGANELDILGTITAATSATQSAGNVRLLIDGVSAYSWRVAFDRTFGAQSLTSSTASDCTVAATNYCYDTDTSDSDTVDLWLRNVGSGWNLRSGTIRAELRT